MRGITVYPVKNVGQLLSHLTGGEKITPVSESDFKSYSLPDNLREIALLRLENPDAPLKELGTFLDPPVGKSGVNHRLRRISEIAETLRE